MLIIAPNCLFYPLVLHASQAALITITFANVVYTAGELAHQLQDARVKLIVAGESVLNVALEAAKMVGIEERNVWSLPESDKDAERAVKEGKRSVACLEGKEQLVPLQVEDDKLETTVCWASTFLIDCDIDVHLESRSAMRAIRLEQQENQKVSRRMLCHFQPLSVLLIALFSRSHNNLTASIRS